MLQLAQDPQLGSMGTDPKCLNQIPKPWCLAMSLCVPPAGEKSNVMESISSGVFVTMVKFR